MSPDDFQPAENEQRPTGPQEDDVSVPPIARHVELPHPPEIEYHRPARAARGQGSGIADARMGVGLSIGISFGLTIVVCIGAGMFIDEHFPVVKPWGTIILSIIGIAAGFSNLIRLANDAMKRDKPK